MIGKILEYFKNISSIPRCSGNEGKMVDYLVTWAKSHNFSYLADENKNVVIYAGGLKSTSKTLALQCHTDMVCEKTLNSPHDFFVDPIELIINGDFISAKDTSLGADNGVGVALAMAISEDEEVLNNTNLELVFTSDEETGLNGAKLIKSSLLKSSKLINLDAESENEIIVGCAGGVDLLGNKSYPLINSSFKNIYKLTIHGLIGGHSGIDIHKDRLNAIKILAELVLKVGGVNLSEFVGGTRHNAIPRSAYALFSCDKDEGYLQKLIDEYEIKVKLNEKNAKFILEKAEIDSHSFLSISDSNCLMEMIISIPNGVNETYDSQVVTSSNLSIFKLKDGCADLLVSIRSSYKSKKDIFGEKLSDIFKKYGFNSELKNEYPAWEPDFNGKLLRIAEREHIELFKRKPQIKVIHAGLECGILLEKYPHLQAISIGPDIYDPHSPSEKVSVSSIANIYVWLKRILINIE